jgi:hypothetical protein
VGETASRGEKEEKRPRRSFVGRGPGARSATSGAKHDIRASSPPSATSRPRGRARTAVGVPRLAREPSARPVPRARGGSGARRRRSSVDRARVGGRPRFEPAR